MGSHLPKFTDYITSFGGGAVSSTQSSKHRDQVSYLLSVGATKIDSPQFLLDLADIIDRKLYKEWQPNTVRAYLNSLRLFIRFLNHMTLLNISEFDYNVTMLTALDDQCVTWMRSLSKAYRKSKGGKSANQEGYINPSDLQAYMQSTRAGQAVSLLTSVPRDDVTMAEHTLARNYLIFCLAMANCQRTGCLTNLTLQEFADGREQVRRGDHIVMVAHHKTSTKYGPATLVVRKELYSQIESYIKHFRPSAISPDSHPKDLFVNWGGSSMDASSVIHALRTELGHAGVEKKLTCTAIRHLAVTLLSGLLPERDLKDLSGLMTHSRAVAEGTYNDAIKGARMARISNITRKVLTQQSLSANDLAEAVNGNWNKSVSYCLASHCNHFSKNQNVHIWRNIISIFFIQMLRYSFPTVPIRVIQSPLMQ